MLNVDWNLEDAKRVNEMLHIYKHTHTEAERQWKMSKNIINLSVINESRIINHFILFNIHFEHAYEKSQFTQARERELMACSYHVKHSCTVYGCSQTIARYSLSH